MEMKSKPSAHAAANSYEINMFNVCRKRIITDSLHARLHEFHPHINTSDRILQYSKPCVNA